MLRLILGRSGFGKTQTVLDSIRAFVSDEQNGTEICYWIVPEQASFEAEKAAVRTLGEKDAARVRVLSFTRMCETLMKQHTKLPLSNGAKIMLMNRTLVELADRLPTLAVTHRTDAVATLLDIAGECRQTGISSQMLADAASTLPEGRLRQKTEELSLLLETYEAFLSQSGSDPQERLSRFAEFLIGYRRLENATVFVDGFKGFTAPEAEVLAALMRQVKLLTVTLCTDRMHDEFGGLDRFSVVMQTARRLIDLAHDNDCAIENERPTPLMTPHRFRNETLEVLEATAFTSETLDVQPSDAVQVTRCADIYEECEYVARTVRRLMREDGVRAREMAIVARNLSEYVGVLDVSLEHAAVPYYLDRRTVIAAESCVTAVLTALSLAVNGWKTDQLMRLVKTGLLGFSVTSLSLFENYVYMWDVKGSQFENDWTAHPAGFKEAMTPDDERVLSRLNRLRRRLMKPLVALSKRLKKAATGEDIAKAAYTYIKQARLDRVMVWQIARLRQNGEAALAEHTLQVWNAMIALLDDIAAVFGDSRITPHEAVELLRTAACATDVGSIPQTLDAVQIGAADRMRFSSPKVVFVLGANEGVFPALSDGIGLLSDRERKALREAGVSFEDHRLQDAAAEQFYAYGALSAASERVYVSYLANTGDGRGEPSSLCHTVLAHLPYLTESRAVSDDGSDIEYTADAFSRMASGIRAKTPLSEALCEVLVEDENCRGRVETISRLANDEPIKFEDTAAAKRFFGDNMILSASKVDAFYNCRFSYFCKYGLKAAPRKRMDWNAMESGTLTHYIMEHVLPVYAEEGMKTIDKARCFADAEQFATQYVQEKMGGLEDKSERFVQLFARLKGVCGRFLWHAVEELSQSHFVPVDYELNVSLKDQDKNAVKPLMLELPDGAKIAMVGQVDRVDLYDDGTRRFLRVIDYKTGKKEFDLTDVVEGINLQMLIYMLTLCENGKSRYGDVLPAGMLYMLSKTPTIKVDSDTTPEKLEQSIRKAMRMNGLLLRDEQVLQAMEPGVKGMFIPAELKKDNSIYESHSSVASLAQFGMLGRRAKKLLTDMAQMLRDGDIDACPYTTSPCKYCDYRAVCGHEEDDRVREPRFDKAAKVLAALEEEAQKEES